MMCNVIALGLDTVDRALYQSPDFDTKCLPDVERSFGVDQRRAGARVPCAKPCATVP